MDKVNPGGIIATVFSRVRGRLFVLRERERERERERRKKEGVEMFIWLYHLGMVFIVAIMSADR